MNYSEMQLVQLKELAKEKGIKVGTAKKAEIIEMLTKHDEAVTAENAEKAKLEAAEKAKAEAAEKAKAEASQAEKKEERREMLRRPVMRENPDRERLGMPQNGQMLRQGQRPMGRPYQNNQLNNQQNNMQQPAARPAQAERTEEAPKPQMRTDNLSDAEIAELDSGIEKNGILEIMSEGFGFIRCDNFLPGTNDVYVAPTLLRRYGLRSGDIVCGNTKIQAPNEKFSALLYVKTINGYTPEESIKRRKFETLTPIFPHERIHLETTGSSVAARIVDLISPIGKGQRGMIVSQPKSGKTTLLKEVANSITTNHPDMHLIILLIDERPEEVTDMKESIKGRRVEVIYSTFDELPEKHKRVSEMVIEHARRLVEHGEDVVILLDSITRLARAYNLTVAPSGRTLSGGLDPAALHMPKKFFGAARTMREGGSLTILATALVETGSRMDDVVFEEFKGTGNMELVLDRNLSEKRIFPAIDIAKSGTRRDDLLLGPDEAEAMSRVRRALNGAHPEEISEKLVNMCSRTRNNRELVMSILKNMNP